MTPSVFKSYRSHSGNQRGAALMFLLVTLSVSGVIVGFWSVTGTENWGDRQLKTITELNNAKKSLIGYAVAYADNYPASGAGVGHFPCPDRDPVNDGVLTNDGPDPPCSRGHSSVGRFPRYTFTRDSGSTRNRRKLVEFYPWRSLLDQQMWYAVSRRFINNPVSTIVNLDTVGDLSVDSVREVVAVIIAPGVELAEAGQSRPSDDIADYLEGENADRDGHFSRTGNDKLVYITADELRPLMLRRVGGYLVKWLQDYRENNCSELTYPCLPASKSELNSILSTAMIDGVTSDRHWLIRNQWLDFVEYQIAPDCLTQNTFDCQVVLVSTAQDTMSSIQIAVNRHEYSG